MLVMPCIPHICLSAFTVVYTGCIVPTSLRCIFAHLSISGAYVFSAHAKQYFRFHSEQWWYHVLKLFSILLKVTATVKLLLSPEKTAGAAWDVAETWLLQMVYALLETFRSPHSIASSWLQSSGLAWGAEQAVSFS